MTIRKNQFGIVNSLPGIFISFKYRSGKLVFSEPLEYMPKAIWNFLMCFSLLLSSLGA